MKDVKVKIEMTLDQWNEILTDVSLRSYAEERADRLYKENEKLKEELSKPCDHDFALKQIRDEE